MARSSNIRRRIDRLLVEQKFRSALYDMQVAPGLLLAALVPAALVMAVALVRVDAAEALQAPVAALQRVAPVKETIATLPVLAAHVSIPAVPAAIMRDVVPELAQAGKSQTDSVHIHEFSDDDENSYAVVTGDSTNATGSWHSGNSFDKVKGKMHGNYIWFERDGNRM